MKKSRLLFSGLFVGRFVTPLIVLVLAAIPCTAQQYKLAGNKVSLKTLFKQIETQTGCAILYQPETIRGLPDVSVSIEATAIKDILDRLLNDLPLDYVIIDKTILIKRKTPTLNDVKNTEAAVSGQVTDEEHLPLPGVTIRSQNNRTGWVTDVNGRFSLRVPDAERTLTFSYIGYTSRQVDVKDLKLPAAIVMKTDLRELNQVQVIAYGTTSKQLNPGNITTVKASDISGAPATNVLEALQGRVPGLFIQQNTGTLGGDYSVKIRSSANFVNFAAGYNNNTPQPIILVDGVTIPVGALPELVSGADRIPLSFRGGCFLNYLNPADIESIDVLKDADATAIYGSRGAYGVIIITTKKAAPGPASFNVNLSSGFSADANLPHLLNIDQYISLRKEALKNDGTAISTSDEDINGTWPANRNINWPKAYLGSFAARTDANLSYSGGNELTNFMLAANFRDRQNVQLKKGAYDDGELRFSINNRKVDNRLSVNITGGLLSSVNDMLGYDLSGNGALFLAPNAPDLIEPDGTLNWNASTKLKGINLLAVTKTIYKNKVQNLLGNGTLNYHPTDRLWLKSVLGYNQLTSDEFSATPTTALAPSATAPQNTASVYNHYNIRSITVSAYAEYTLPVSKGKGSINLKAGGELNSRQTDVNNLYGYGFSSDALLNNPGLGNSGSANYNTINYRNIGFFGIAKMVWADQYIVDINVRRDGSSRFGEANRFGNFGSAGAAWIFSKQQWMEELMPFISFAKLRASAGIVGGDAFPDYAFLATYNQLNGTYAGQTGLQNSVLANPNVQWERNKRIDAALELGVFKNRIYLEADFYNNHSTNELVNQPASSVTGSTIASLNADAVIETSGWEFSLTTANIRKNTFSWTSNFNLSIPKNKLLSLPHADLNIVSSSVIVGKPVTGVVLYNYAGVNPQTGNYNFTNAQGQTNEHLLDLTAKDKTEFLDLAPKFFGGFKNSFRYHSFQLDFFLSFVKRSGPSYWGQRVLAVGGGNTNIPTDALRRWQQPGDITDIPRASAGITSIISSLNFFNSTGAYTDASYIRMQQMSLNYDIIGDILKKIKVKKLSLNLKGQNLFTITRYKNGDPEQLNSNLLPTLSMFTAGINASF